MHVLQLLSVRKKSEHQFVMVLDRVLRGRGKGKANFEGVQVLLVMRNDELLGLEDARLTRKSTPCPIYGCGIFSTELSGLPSFGA